MLIKLILIKTLYNIFLKKKYIIINKMGIKLSTLNYNFEFNKIDHEYYLCCPLFNQYENFFFNRNGIYIFKSNKSNDWLYFEGNINLLFNDNYCIDESLLINNSKQFNNIYELINYKNINKEIMMSLINYQKDNIKTEYLNEIV